MGAARIIVLSVALVAAIGLAVVVRNMTSGPQGAVDQAEAAPPAPMARVLVASRDLGIGVRLTPADLMWQSWPVDGLNPNFVTDGTEPAPPPETTLEKAAEGASAVAEALTGSEAMDSLVGAIVREPILDGEPIQPRKLVRGGEGGYLAVVLQPGMRALAVPVSSTSGAGGFILPGDRVDVIQSRQVDSISGDTEVRITQPVVVNVRVLAIDQITQPAEDSNAIVGGVATLEVTPDAASALVEAMAEGDMQLALRSYADLNAPSGRISPTANDPSSPIRTVRIFSQNETVEAPVAR
jgi:pilus assembly protein CpaB